MSFRGRRFGRADRAVDDGDEQASLAESEARHAGLVGRLRAHIETWAARYVAMRVDARTGD